MRSSKRMSFHRKPKLVPRKAPISKPTLKPNPKQGPKNRLIKRKRIFKTQANAYEQEVFRLVNQERTSRGLRPLTLNSRLTEVARLKSMDMRDNNYFGHNSPTYGTPEQMLARFGISGYAGENIAAGYATPQAVMNGWMNSPGHRSNILNPNAREIGVGYVAGTSTSEYQHYWTQLFIR